MNARESLTGRDVRPAGDSGSPPDVKDTGLRRILTWTVVALVVSLLMAYVGVGLAVHFFDRP